MVINHICGWIIMGSFTLLVSVAFIALAVFIACGLWRSIKNGRY